MNNVFMIMTSALQKGDLPVVVPHDSEDIPLKSIGSYGLGASFYDIKSINLGYKCAGMYHPAL